VTATETLRLPAPPAQPEPVEAPAYDVDPGEREHDAPVDLDACETCGGTGVVRAPAARLGHPESYVDCRACEGTGDRMVPTVFRGWAV